MVRRFKSSRQRKAVMAKIHTKLPKGHKLIAVARNLTQARSLIKSYPKDARAIIVSTKKNKVFPYHIASDSPYY